VYFHGEGALEEEGGEENSQEKIGIDGGPYTNASSELAEAVLRPVLEASECDAEDEEGDGVGDACAAEEVAGGDAEHEGDLEEEDGVVRAGAGLLHRAGRRGGGRRRRCGGGGGEMQ